MGWAINQCLGPKGVDSARRRMRCLDEEVSIGMQATAARGTKLNNAIIKDVTYTVLLLQHEVHHLSPSRLCAQSSALAALTLHASK